MFIMIYITPGKWQSKTLLKIDERESRTLEAWFFIVIRASRATNGNRNLCSNDFLSTFVDINVFDCRLPSLYM